MKAIIKFKPDSPYYKAGEQERVVDNLTEVHYCYPSFHSNAATAFESHIDGTGFTLNNEYIQEFEITTKHDTKI